MELISASFHFKVELILSFLDEEGEQNIFLVKIYFLTFMIPKKSLQFPVTTKEQRIQYDIS